MARSTGIRSSLLRGITRNVVALGLVSLLTDISSELLVYVIPLFLANVLAATPTVIGVVEGIAESIAAFVKLGSGALSDRIGRRKILVGTGYGTSVVAKALYLVATTWPLVLVARVGDRIGKGIRTAPRDALIADSTSPEARGRAFGLHRAMDTLGAVVGVGLAALIVGLAQGDATQLSGDTFRLLAIAALVPGVLALVAIAVGVRDIPRAALAKAGPAATPEPTARSAAPTAAANVAVEGAPSVAVTQVTPPPSGPTRAAALRSTLGRFPRPFWVFVAASGLFTLGNSSDAFLALRSQALGVSVRDLMLIVIAFNLVNSIIAWPVGAWSDQIGRRRLIGLGWGLYAVTYAGFALAGDGAAVLPLWLIYGAYYGVNEAVGRALVADLALPELRATAYGILNSVMGLAILPASIVAGILWDQVGQAAPFWFGSACAAGGLVLLAFVHPPRR